MHREIGEKHTIIIKEQIPKVVRRIKMRLGIRLKTQRSRHNSNIPTGAQRRKKTCHRIGRLYSLLQDLDPCFIPHYISTET